MIDKLAILLPDATYHIYNRANSNERLFRNDDNYTYFLKKYLEYISPIAETFCFCLMPNHFHFLIRVRPENTLIEYLKAGSTLTGFETLSGLPASLEERCAHDKKISEWLSQQFSHLFNGYTQAFNKRHKRWDPLESTCRHASLSIL